MTLCAWVDSLVFSTHCHSASFLQGAVWMLLEQRPSSNSRGPSEVGTRIVDEDAEAWQGSPGSQLHGGQVGTVPRACMLSLSTLLPAQASALGLPSGPSSPLGPVSCSFSSSRSQWPLPSGRTTLNSSHGQRFGDTMGLDWPPSPTLVHISCHTGVGCRCRGSPSSSGLQAHLEDHHCLPTPETIISMWMERNCFLIFAERLNEGRQRLDVVDASKHSCL